MMNIRFSRSTFALIVCLILFGSLNVSNSYAADDKVEDRNVKIIKKLKRDNAILQADFAKQKTVMDETLKKTQEDIVVLEAELAEEQAKSKGLEATLSKVKRTLEAKLAETESTLESTKTALANMTAQYEQGVASLEVNDRQRKTQLTNLAETSRALQSCEGKNERLYNYGTELIKTCQDPDVITHLLRNEKVTQIKRVVLENLLQDYNDKLDAQRISINNK